MLQALAEQCQREPDGSLVGAWGGWQLREACELSESTVRRTLRELEELGCVVCLRLAENRRGISRPHEYGLPGRRGALDQERVQRPRRARRIERPRGDQGAPGLVEVQPTEQSPLWSDVQVTENRDDVRDRDRSERPGAMVNLTTPPSHFDQVVSRGFLKVARPGCAPGLERSGSGTGSGVFGAHLRVKDWSAPPLEESRPRAAPQRRRDDRPRISDVRRGDLGDAGRLIELHRQAAARGWCRDSENDLLMVIAAAECALRCERCGEVDDAVRFFAWMVSKGRLMRVLEKDLDAASQRLKAWRREHGG